MSKKRLINNIILSTALLCSTMATSVWAGSYGAVTALSVSTSNLGAFVGYSSGVVALCVRGMPCQVYTGTPESPVTALDTDKVGNSVRVWAGYKNGDVYFCVTGECNLLTEGMEVTGKSNRVKVPLPVYIKQP